MTKTTGFYAYPSQYFLIGPPIEGGVSDFNDRSASTKVTTWKELDVAGRFISSQVLSGIAETDFFVADISYLNFNVTFEIGYAIGRNKPILLTRMAAVGGTNANIDEVGIFDTIGYVRYNNREEIRRLLQTPPTTSLLGAPREGNHKAPVYLIDSKFQTDEIRRMIARVKKKARLFFRSFDPVEQPRMSAQDATRSRNPSAC